LFCQKRAFNRAQGRRIFHHETQQPGEDSGDRPRGVPGVGMKVADGKAETLVAFEPSTRCDHIDCWRSKRKLSRENKFPMIVAAVVGRFLRAADLKRTKRLLSNYWVSKKYCGCDLVSACISHQGTLR